VLRKTSWSNVGGSNRKLEKTAHCGASRFIILTKLYYGDKIKDEMGKASGMYGDKRNTYSVSAR
jgi:hypothetical protein